LRLMGPIIAVVLAITMAIFPIPMPRAAAWHGPQDAVMLGSHHTHDGASVSCDDASPVACGDHEHGTRDTGPGCCGVGMCHAFQVSGAPDVHSPDACAVPMAIVGDEQVAGLVSGRLDRPPRSV
jgi:hypothetical protein